MWDIGANIGLFTLTAAVKAGRTGKVLSVEADVFNSYILSKSLKANPDLNIDLLTCAIANQKGLVQFNIANRARCSNFINLSKGNTDSGGVRNYYNVLSLTLDEIIKWYDAPDFIKVDIEGAEKYLLAGAVELFQMYTPIVYMEVEKINAAYIKEFFKSKGYKMFDGENPSIEIFEPVSNTVFIHFKSQQ